MNPFVFACMTPHGSEIIEELSQPDVSLMQKTRKSMERLGAWMRDANPDTIIVLTPHGLRVDSQFSITDSERMYGEVEDHGATVTMEREIDRDLARQIVSSAQGRGLPVAAVNFATASGPMSCLPMDWGVIVPLYFMPKTQVVVITPTRQLSFAQHLDFGAALADAVSNSGKRVALIASCDWSHAHDENGPYGYHPAAKQLDEMVVQYIQDDDLEAMTALSPEFVENAKPDGIWQALILAGAVERADRQGEFLSYEVPTYFGLICAAYHSNRG